MNTKNVSLSANDKMALMSNMHTMLAAGIPILETIDSLLEDAKGNQKKLLEELKQDLIQGQHMYFTFSKFPKIFDNVTVNIIKASEEAGRLDITLKDITQNIRKEMEFNDKIRSALIYPFFIMGVFIAVLTVILVVVVPRISTVFVRLNIELPLPTKIMIFMSNILLNYTILVILGLAALISGTIYLYKSNKKLFINGITAMPYVSKLAQEIDLTRFTRSLYLLLTAGIPITNALELSQDVVVKQNVRRAIIHIKNVVLSGKKLSEGLKDNKRIVPPIMIKIIEAGEKSGTLDQSMADVSEYLDYQVSSTLKTLTALIEPIMLVLVGILVGGMMLAIIAPIYNLIGQLGPR